VVPGFVNVTGDEGIVFNTIIQKHFLEYSALIGKSANSTLGFCWSITS